MNKKTIEFTPRKLERSVAKFQERASQIVAAICTMIHPANIANENEWLLAIHPEEYAIITALGEGMIYTREGTVFYRGIEVKCTREVPVGTMHLIPKQDWRRAHDLQLHDSRALAGTE